MSNATDEELMQRVRAGDGSAFEEIYDRHSRRAMRIALSVTSDPQLAAEAVQDGFLTVWRRGDRYSPERGTFQAWAMTLVHHRAIDLLRREQARPTAPEANMPQLADPRSDLLASVERRTETRRVRAVLDSLPRLQREALVLAYYGGLSQSQIADQLSVPLGTVKGRMRLGLEKLRELLTPEAVGSGHGLAGGLLAQHLAVGSHAGAR